MSSKIKLSKVCSECSTHDYEIFSYLLLSVDDIRVDIIDIDATAFDLNGMI